MASRYSAHMWVYLNNKLVEKATAAIDIQDRGFRYGDGLFETIKVQNGTALHFDRHIRRLVDGLTALKFSAPLGDIQILCRQLIAQNQMEDGVLRIAISRGLGGRGYLPPREAAPTIVIETLPLPEDVPASKTLWLSTYTKMNTRALPVHLKLAQGMNSILAALEAQENGCDDALLLNDAGAICETSNSNLFWKKGDSIFTPEPNCGILEGITRQILCECWKERLILSSSDINTLRNAEALIAVNSVTGATAITQLKNPPISWASSSFAEEANEALVRAARNYVVAQGENWS